MISLVKNLKINIKYIKNKKIFLVFISNCLIYTYKLKKVSYKNLGIIITNYLLLLRILRQFGLIKTLLNKLEY